jgi:eukaryotic-like serine/threonine-protein kinase
LEEARSVLQQALDNKADNLFIHQQLFEAAFLNGDSDGMQRQMKWAEGKPSEYLLLNDDAAVAAAHGQMRKADELLQRSAQVTEHLGFKGTTADAKANWALTQAEAGNTTKARELAAASSALAGGRSNMVSVALALAITGDVSRAQSIVDALGRRFRDDTLLHNVNIPAVTALVALNRKNPDQAIAVLQSATPYELGTAQGLFPIYVRALAYLQAKRGPEAVAEFQRIVDHRGISPVAPEHSLAKLGLGRAYVVTPAKQKARIRISSLCGKTPTPKFQS